MNIYDKKSIRCVNCDMFIGEIDYDAQVVLPKCGHCANPKPEGDDSLSYLASKIENKIKNSLVVLH